jgi:outer membrane murein-binding lipoprotein Lpp
VFIGFFIGQKVQAGTTGPGTVTDPLVTKSYVDSLITKVDELNKKVITLEGKVNTLEKKVSTTATTKQATVITTTANIRKTPDTKASILKVAKKGDKFTVAEKVSSTWYKIKISSSSYGYLYYTTVSVK